MTTPYDFTVQSLRQQLPIFKDYEGMPWCSQEINGKVGYTQWVWANATDSIVVNANRDGNVTIFTRPDEEGDRAAISRRSAEPRPARAGCLGQWVGNEQWKPIT